MDYTIRPVTTDDVAELQKISRETFKGGENGLSRGFYK